MALLSQGTNGSTFEELDRGLNLGGNKTVAANKFNEYFGLLEKSAGQSVLSMVNQIYVQHEYKIKKEFRKVAVEKFMSVVESMNFVDSNSSAQAINQFIKNKTNDKIQDLIKPSMLNADTQILLVNAIYFKGAWTHKFPKSRTIKGDFYLNETQTVSVDFMRIERPFSYAILEDLNATALEMTYDNSNFSFVAILPNDRIGLSALENQLEEYDLAKITNQMQQKVVTVIIPKFKVEYEINLNDALKNVRFQMKYRFYKVDFYSNFH